MRGSKQSAVARIVRRKGRKRGAVVGEDIVCARMIGSRKILESVNRLQYVLKEK